MTAQPGLNGIAAFDEGRFGLKTWLRRRWCPCGERPPALFSETYEWLWLYAAVEPASGRAFFLLLPHVDGPCFELFLHEASQYFDAQTVTLVLDNAPSHHNQQINWPDHLKPLYLPPYSPELNPAEQIFRHLRKVLANQVFDSLAALETALIAALRTFYDHPEVLVSLTNYPWWHAVTRTLSN